MLYRQILKQAWQITRKNKWLWFFGFLVSLIGGWEGPGILFSFSVGGPEGLLISFFQGLINGGFFSLNVLVGIKEVILTAPLSFLVFLAVILTVFGLIFFIIWLTLISQGALIKGVKDVTANKVISWPGALSAGISNFWSIFSFNVILKIVSGACLLILVKVLWSQGWLLWFSFVVFLILINILSFIIKYSICFLVIKGDKFRKSFWQGALLFARNWLVSLELAVILIIINFFAFLGLTILTFFATLPLLAIIYIFYLLNFIFWIWAFIFLTIIFLTILLILFSAVLTTFIWSVWILLFIELTQNKIKSWLIDKILNFKSKR